MTSQKASLERIRDLQAPEEDFSRWRLRMATYIASQTDPEKFGVAGFYLIGSTKNATAGPASDIDLLLHVRGTEEQQKLLEAWLEEWSVYLDEINYRKTGYRTGGLLDIHIVTDEDIAQKTSFAAKIGAITDAAQKLPMMKDKRCKDAISNQVSRGIFRVFQIESD